MLLTRDKYKLAAHFRKDSALFAYHIGDLDDIFFPLCRWPAFKNGDGRISEALLIYDHPQFPTVMAFGLSDQCASLIEQSLDILPDRFFCHYQGKFGAIFRRHFEKKSFGPHYKMELDPKKFAAFKKSRPDDYGDDIVRFDKSHGDLLTEFYKTAYPDGYFDERMLLTGKFFGVCRQDRPAAVAGIHVYSNEFNIAVLGSVATAPEFRGRGLASRATAHLVNELLSENKSVFLHVGAENNPALACYKKIGFRIAHEYEEAFYVRS